MIFDDSHSIITDQLSGRVIEYVTRNGKVLELHTTCGHIIKLQADTDYDIHYRGTDVSVTLTGANLISTAGKF